MQPITQSELKLVSQAGALSRIRIEPVNTKWVVVARIGLDERLLFTARGAVKEFSSLDRLASFLKKLGIQNSEIKLV